MNQSLTAAISPSLAAAGRLLSALRRADRALLASLALLVGVALFVPRQLPATLRFTIDSAVGILPFLLVSVLSAAWLRAAGADRLIGRAFVARPVKAIMLASLLGALSPFCSCGVIPLISALLASGVPLAPVMAFWTASPIIDPEMYFITAGALGFQFATAKTVAAVGIGLTAGLATLALQRLPSFAEPLRRRACAACGNPLLSTDGVRWRFWQEPARVVQFHEGAVHNTAFLGKWLLLAFLLESLMLAWVPAGSLASWVGDNAFAIPVAAVVGVPAYLNGYAAVPVVAGFLQTGMTPGAALAFMAAGAMTSIPAAVAVSSLVKRRVFVWYLGLALTLSMASGYGYSAWLAL